MTEKRKFGNCWFIFMGEYCDESGGTVSVDHPLSFRSEMNRIFFDNLGSSAAMKPKHIVFRDETNIGKLEDMIESVGGIDVCYGNIDNHGYAAFNMPEANVVESGDRQLAIQAFLWDPLISSHLTLDQTKELFDELLEIEKPYLPQFYP